MSLNQLQAEARRRGIPIRGRNAAQLRTALRRADEEEARRRKTKETQQDRRSAVPSWVAAGIALVALLALLAVGLLARTISTPTPTETPATATETPIESCPTEAEFEKEFGFWADRIGTEPCAFHWYDMNHPMLVTNPCPENWVCTIGVVEDDGMRTTYVYVGNATIPPLRVYGGTWRRVSAYPKENPVHNACAFFEKVQAEGQNSDPRWEPLTGNFSCNQ